MIVQIGKVGEGRGRRYRQSPAFYHLPFKILPGELFRREEPGADPVTYLNDIIAPRSYHSQL